MARVKKKTISFIFLSMDTFQADKKPDVDCSRQKPFVCERDQFSMSESQTALIFNLKFSNINFPRICK